MTVLPILKLPSELILLIFEAEHSIGDTLSLSSTCNKLRSIWRHYYLRITDTILPRELHGYNDALALAEAQGAFEPSQYQKRLDAAQSELLDATATLESEPPTARASQELSSVPYSAYGGLSAMRIKAAKDTIEEYREMGSLAGDGGHTDAYQLHLRHLRRIHRNARVATSIAELFMRSDLRRSTRQPVGRESYWLRGVDGYDVDPVVPEALCPYHPFDKSLPHEDERASQCVYHIRLRVLGDFDRDLDRRCRKSAEAMSLRKAYGLHCLSSFVMSSHRKKEARILGIYRLGAAAKVDLTPEWIRATSRISSVFFSRVRTIYGSDAHMDGASFLDTCNAGIAPCTGNEGGKDLWDSSFLVPRP